MFARRSGPRTNLCLLAVFVLTIVLSISSLVHQRRNQPFSCRTWNDCGFLERASYTHDVPADLDIVVDQGTSRDDGGGDASSTTFYTREILNLSARPNLLVLVVSNGPASWGADARSTARSPADLVDLLVRTELDLTGVSIGVLTTDRADFDAVKEATRTLPFARTSIYLQPRQQQQQSDDKTRPDDATAEAGSESATLHARRANIARARNYLMLRTLQDEAHLLWLDADVVELSAGLVQRMLRHAEGNPDIGLLTARCRLRSAESDYDTKAWSVHRGGDGDGDGDGSNKTTEGILGAVDVAGQSAAATELRRARKQAGELLRDDAKAGSGGNDDALVPLDSTGATVLYVRASLVLRGVSFPAFNVVGTLWDHDGWTGLETEGICYMARQVAGKGCFLLGGSNFVRHADLGTTVS
ncbi:Anp1-like protein [Microdochium nivale]|nr:Anp1-like protein [Microdochium nivale]